MYFVHLREHPGAGLYVSQPVIGRITPVWLWTFARRIDGAGDRFAGTVVAAMEVEVFDAMFAQVKLGRGGSIELRDRDLRLIARTVEDGEDGIPVGDSRLSLALHEALRASPDAGSYVDRVDAGEMLTSYRRNARHGFFVQVGLPMSTVLAGWRDEIVFVGLPTAFFLIATLVFALILGRAWRRQEEALAAGVRRMIALTGGAAMAEFHTEGVPGPRGNKPETGVSTNGRRGCSHGRRRGTGWP